MIFGAIGGVVLPFVIAAAVGFDLVWLIVAEGLFAIGSTFGLSLLGRYRDWDVLTGLAAGVPMPLAAAAVIVAWAGWNVGDFQWVGIFWILQGTGTLYALGYLGRRAGEALRKRYPPPDAYLDP